MLTWTSVVATAPTDNDIAAAVAGRSALVIRPLIEFGPLRRAMGLPTVDDRTGEVEAAVVTVASTGRRRTAGSATASSSRPAATKQSKPKSTKPRSAAKAAPARTPATAAA